MKRSIGWTAAWALALVVWLIPSAWAQNAKYEIEIDSSQMPLD